MPLPSHRLDLYAMSAQIDDDSFGHRLFDLGRDEGWWTPDGLGRPGLIEGGFSRARLDTFDEIQMISNQLGGFRVRCPACATPMARAFGDQVSAWRRGAPRAVVCPSCAETVPLEAVDCRPPVGFARSWVHLVDVERAVLLPAAHKHIVDTLGTFRIVGRRPS